MQSESNTKLPAVTVERHGGNAVVIVRVGFSESERDGVAVYTFDEEHGETPYFDGLEDAVNEDVGAWHAHFKEVNAEGRKPTDSERLDALMEYMGLRGSWNGNAFEVVKDTDKPAGDYTNPIQWLEGDPVTAGLFYWFDDYDMRLEALADGIPTAWGEPPFEQMPGA